MILKLRIKFMAINMSIVTVMLGIILGLIYYFTLADIETSDITMMFDIAEDPSEPVVPGNSPDNVRLPFFVLEKQPDGRIHAVGNYFDLTDEVFLDEIISIVQEREEETGIIDEYLLRYLKVDMSPVQTIVFLDISSETAVLDNLIGLCAGIGAASFLVFLVLSFFLAKWATNPLERAWKQQTQFVSDASHELKTPITVIMTNAELLQNPDYGEEEKSRFSEAILVMSKQMRSLIEQLLELARADNVGGKEIFCKIDFSGLLSDAILPFEPLFFEKGLTICTEIEADIFVIADADKMRQVIDILLDNAQKYSNERGVTQVKLCRKGKNGVLLSVSNEGDAIPPTELKNLFKRFYRVDKARSRDGSFGLGLSIAESIVSMHKGRIWAESRDNVNTFYVELRASV